MIDNNKILCFHYCKHDGITTYTVFLDLIVGTPEDDL